MKSNQVYKIRLKKGDTVIVRSGKHKGKTGKITALHPSLNKVTIEGVNIVKRNLKPSRANPHGGSLEITKPIWISKVGIIDPTTKKASKIAYKVTKDGQKSRIFKSSGKEIK